MVDARTTSGTHEAEVARGKRVRFRKRTHGHILGGPLPDTRNLAEPGEKVLYVSDSFKANMAVTHGPRQSANRLRTRLGEADTGEGRLG